MEEIIVMNDNSVEALHAGQYAFNLACIYNKNVLIANLNSTRKSTYKKSPVVSGNDFQTESEDDETNNVIVDYINRLTLCPEFPPEVRFLDISNYEERDLVRYINRQKVWMVVQGVATGENFKKPLLNLQSVLNRVQCPFMLLPADATFRPLERLVYMADLRYAQIPVINFLAKMYSGVESVILAHICEQGLPDLDNSYAMDLFSNGINRNTSCDRLFFSYLRGKNFIECIDHIINGMQADMLVCVNHHYHFEQLLGGNMLYPLPDDINMPVLVFPH